MESFATLIRRLRIARGLTQDQLAAAATCSVSVIAKAEQSGRVPSDRLQHALYRGLASRQDLAPADLDAWATATGVPRSLLTGSTLVAAAIAAATGPTGSATDHAALAQAAFTRLLAIADAAAVARVMDALEHLTGAVYHPLTPPPPTARPARAKPAGGT
jgi:transcriptional regulator with XRE-family HTH domain